MGHLAVEKLTIFSLQNVKHKNITSFTLYSKPILATSNSFPLIMSQILQSSGKPTDKKRRSQNSYTAPCNGIVSHGTSIGGIKVFADHTSRHKRKQNVSTIFAHCVAFHTCVPSHSDHSTYGPDES